MITIIFCDLVESTALSELIDPEEFRDLLNQYQNTCAEVVRSFGGYLAHLLGDGVVIYFGYPIAHEDDEIRAVRCSLAIQDAVRELSATSPHNLRVRIGLHRGRVVVGAIGDQSAIQPMAVGETPNIAARLQAEASPGDVVVSDALWRLIEPFFEGEPMGSRRLKGIRDPIEIHRVTQFLSTPNKTIAVSPFVGRTDEREQIDQAWRLTLNGSPQTVLVLGEPGIGKSRLIEQVISSLSDSNPLVLQCHCNAFSSDSPYMPLVEMVQNHLGLKDLPPAHQLSRVAGWLSSLGLDQPETLPLFARFLALETDDQQQSILDALSPLKQRQRTQALILEVLTRLSAASPVLLILEDLHWVDASTLELISHFSSLTPGSRVLLLLSSRHDVDITWPANPGLTRICLGLLVSDESEQIIRAVACNKQLPYELIRQIGLRSAGNPLFLEEITLSVLSSESLLEREKTWELLEPFSADLVPNTLEAALMARLDRLDEAKLLLQIGSVFGREFRTDLLCAVCPWRVADIQSALAGMVDEGFLLCTDQAGKSYRFKHALVQDVAYRSLLLSTRQDYHSRIAETLGAEFSDIGMQRPELLAYHLSGAQRFAESARMWLAAGQSALQRSAVIEAVDHLNRGLTDLESLDEDDQSLNLNLSISLSLAPAQMAVLGWASPMVETTCRRAIKLAERLGFDDQRFAPLWGLWSNQFVAGQLFNARDAAELMLLQAQRSHQAVHIVAAYNAASYTYFYRAEYELAIQHADDGLLLYDPDQERQLCLILQSAPSVHMHSARANALWMQGRELDAELGFQSMLELARGLVHAPSLAAALAYRCFFASYTSEWSEVLPIAQELLDLSGQEGYTLWHAVAALYKSAALLNLNPDADSADKVLECAQLLRQTGALVTDPSTSVLIMQALFAIGRLADAVAEADLALMTARRGDVWVMVPEVHRCKADGLSRLGQLDEADQAYLNAVKTANAQGAFMLKVRALSSMLRHRLTHGYGLELAADLHDLLAQTSPDNTAQDIRSARHLLSALA